MMSTRTARGMSRAAPQLPAMQQMGENVMGRVAGSTLYLEIELSQAAANRARTSSSGKSKLLATTNGALAVFGSPVEGVKLAMNVTIPA